MAGMLKSVALVAICAVAATSCGDERETVRRADGGRLVARVTCEKGTSVPIEVLDTPKLDPGHELVIAASRESAKNTSVDYGDPFPKDGWRLVSREADEVTMLFGGIVLVMERKSGEWRYKDSDGCTAGPDLRGRGEAEWYPAADVPESAKNFTAHVTGLACSGGRSAEGRIDEPVIEYREDAILILFTVEPLPEGFYTCPGNPPAPFTVELREPRGDRRLFDARTYPPSDVTEVRSELDRRRRDQGN